jgi:hypothetical protein
VVLEGKKIALPVRWTLNGDRVSTDKVISEGDRLEIVRIKTLGEFIAACGLPRDSHIYGINGERADFTRVLNDGDTVSLKKKEPGREITVMVNGEKINLPYREKPYIFVDLFNYMDFDAGEARGKIDLVINGKKAGYTDIIKEGDSIEINWNKV